MMDLRAADIIGRSYGVAGCKQGEEVSEHSER